MLRCKRLKHRNAFMFDSQSGWKLNNQQISHLIYGTQSGNLDCQDIERIFGTFDDSSLKAFRNWNGWRERHGTKCACVHFVCVCVLSQTFPQQTLFIFPSHRFNFHSSLIFIIGTNKKIEDKKIQLFRNGIHSIKVNCVFIFHFEQS